MEHPKIQKQAKKSWIAYLAPVYAFAICAYVLFMVYRITTKQVTVQWLFIFHDFSAKDLDLKFLLIYIYPVVVW